MYQVTENGETKKIFRDKVEARKYMKEKRHESLILREDNIYEIREIEIEDKYSQIEDMNKYYRIKAEYKLSNSSKKRVVLIREIKVINQNREFKIINSTLNSKTVMITLSMEEVLNKRVPYEYIKKRVVAILNANRIIHDNNDNDRNDNKENQTNKTKTNKTSRQELDREEYNRRVAEIFRRRSMLMSHGII